MNKLEATSRQLRRQIDLAKEAGVWDYTMLAFGSLLGYARNRGIIPHDDDMDLMIATWLCPEGSAEAYFKLCQDDRKRGTRWNFSKHPKWDSVVWTTFRLGDVGKCYKCCTWYKFAFAGVAWHTKGPGSLVKGCPLKACEPGAVVKFLGVEVKIPVGVGVLLDHWYPHWSQPLKGGNSSRRWLMHVGDWRDEKTWRVERK